jgi:tyrosine-protein kinase Etk/Wzc
LQTPKSLLNEIQSGLEIKVDDPSAKTVRVSFQHNNAKFTTDVVNQLLYEYDLYVIAKKSLSSENILTFIKDQKDTVDKRVKESEQMIQLFQRSNDLKGTSGFSSSYLSQLSEMETQFTMLEVEKSVLAHLSNTIKNFNEETNIDEIVPALIGRSFESTLQSLIIDLKSKIDKRRDLLSTATLDNTSVKKLNSEINSQINLILKSIKVVTQQNTEKLEAVGNQISMLKGVLFSLPEKELELARLNRVMEINNKYYTMLLEKETEYQLSTAGIATYNQILNPADIPNVAISPNKSKVYLIAIVFWLVISIVTLLFKYVVHDKINSLTDITKLTNASVSILGIVPKYKEKIENSQLIISKNPKSLMAEAFRSLRTNMQFISNFDGPKTLGVTSTISGEGKTFVAINLGGIIAYSGKKVIIIDLDMRKPKIHLGFEVENSKGMSTILIGKENVMDCIYKSTQENLDFITAGPIPPNPSELIMSAKLR